jgi:hypothetical protein
MEAALRQGYDNRLYFHYYGHALDTRDEARERGKWCAYEDLAADPDNCGSINFRVLEWAALGHDYGFYAWTFLPDEEKARYPSRERYAAAETSRIMASLDAPEDVIAQVEAAIRSTELNVACTTREGRVLRQADLANVGNATSPRNLAAFFWSTVALYREKRLLGGQSPDRFIPLEFLDFCLKSYKVLAAYNAEDVSLGGFDRTPDGRSLFCAAAAEKISRLKKPLKIIELARQAGATLLRDLSPKHFED